MKNRKPAQGPRREASAPRRVEPPAAAAFSGHIVSEVLLGWPSSSGCTLSEADTRDAKVIWIVFSPRYQAARSPQEVAAQATAIRQLVCFKSATLLPLLEGMRAIVEDSLVAKMEAALGREPRDDAEWLLAMRRCEDLTATESLFAGLRLDLKVGERSAPLATTPSTSRAAAGLEYLDVLALGIAHFEAQYDACASENPDLADLVQRAKGEALGHMRKILPELALDDAQRLWPHHALLRRTAAALRTASPALGRLAYDSPLEPLLCADRALAGGPVLVRGETGTGKEDTSRAVHELSSRAGGPFLPVNIGGLSTTLADSELFGHVEGAFTGATATHEGAFFKADGGTLFLDEIGDIPEAVQVKLLRAMDRVPKIRRVGTADEIEVDVRLVFATNRDLEQLVKAGAMRRDFYERLTSGRTLWLEPLRERSDADLAAVWSALLDRLQPGATSTPAGSTASTIARLRQHKWPGNVRELQTFAHEYVDFNRDRVPPWPLRWYFDLVDQYGGLRESNETSAAAGPGMQALDDEWQCVVDELLEEAGRTSLRKLEERIQRDVLTAALARNDGNGKLAAASLGLRPIAFYQRCRRAGA